MTAYIGSIAFNIRNNLWGTASCLPNQRESRTNEKEKGIGQHRLNLYVQRGKGFLELCFWRLMRSMQCLSWFAGMLQQRHLTMTSFLGWWWEAQGRQQSLFSHNNSYYQRGGCSGHPSYVHWDSLLWICLWGHTRSKFWFRLWENKYSLSHLTQNGPKVSGIGFTGNRT